MILARSTRMGSRLLARVSVSFICLSPIHPAMGNDANAQRNQLKKMVNCK